MSRYELIGSEVLVSAVAVVIPKPRSEKPRAAESVALSANYLMCKCLVASFSRTSAGELRRGLDEQRGRACCIHRQRLDQQAALIQRKGPARRHTATRVPSLSVLGDVIAVGFLGAIRWLHGWLLHRESCRTSNQMTCQAGAEATSPAV